MLFRVLAGRHTEKDGKTYSKNDVVSTDVDLVAVFGDQKFLREVGMELGMAPTPSLPTPSIQSNVSTTPSVIGGQEVIGQDVTVDYPIAKDNELLVFKKGRVFFVTDIGAPQKPLNDTPLKRTEVLGFINNLFEDV